MTTIGWIIWFAILGLGAVILFWIGLAADRKSRREDEAREREDRR